MNSRMSRIVTRISVALAAGAVHAATPAQLIEDNLKPLPAGAVDMRGELGSRIDLIAARRVWGLPAPQNKQQQDFCGNLADPLSIVEPFETKTEHTKRGGSWVGEFWGKWMTAAALAYHYRPKDDSLKILKRSADRLMATQDASGYIGTYKPAHRYVSWETWCMKYTLLGLLAYHDETGDKAALAALTRLADDLLANVGPGKKPLGNYGETLLEPMVLTYFKTGDAKYLTYAKWLADVMQPGLEEQIKSQVLKGHAYVNMSRCEGLLELHRATGDTRYRELAIGYHKVIRDTERVLVGSGSSGEGWCGRSFDGQSAIAAQDRPDFMISIELCATVTWLKLNYQLLRLTGESRFADEIEWTTYNILFKNFDRDSGLLTRYVGLAALTNICCNSSGPRAPMLLPRLAVMYGESGPVDNLYENGSATIPLQQGNRVRLVQTTEYPLEDAVTIAVRPEKAAEFAVKLRIPAWSARSEVAVNDAPQDIKAVPGTYLTLRRTWQPGYTIRLKLDLRGRIFQAPSGSGALAVLRGPLVLAMKMDKDPGGWSPYHHHSQKNPEGFVEIKRLPPSAGQWASFSVPIISCGGKPKEMRLNDYATAGTYAQAWCQKAIESDEPEQNYVRGRVADVSWWEKARGTVAFLTDGRKAGGAQTYKGAAQRTQTPNGGDWVEFVFCKPVSINRVVLHPCTDALAANNATANFPVDFSLTYKASEDDATYTTIRSYTDYPNPKGDPQTLVFPAVRASRIRLAVTKLGLASAKEPTAYRLQLAEIEIGDSGGKSHVK